jgi:AcrR family transcriptional regulator
MVGGVTPDQLAALPLRERKKVLTRAAIVEAAQRLFEERGFDNVTVAEIADAANVSVKTLFVYFRAKEELAFADNELIDEIIAAMAARKPGTSHAEAVAAELAAQVRAQGDPVAGLEGFHRGYGKSPAIQSGLLRLWADYEDRVTAFLAAEACTGPTPQMRLHAVQLVAIPRTLTSPEVRALVEGLPPERARSALEGWLREAARSVTAPG